MNEKNEDVLTVPPDRWIDRFMDDMDEWMNECICSELSGEVEKWMNG